MLIIHPFQRSFCVLFLTLAFIVFFIHIRKPRYEIIKAFSNINSLLYEEMFKEGNNLSYPREIFDVVELLNSTLELQDDTNITLEHAGDDAIYVLGLFDLTTGAKRQKDKVNELAAAELAVRHVNALNILPGYKLVLLINDTQCDPGVAIDRLFHAIYSSKTILMLLDSSCSNISEALARIVPYWNIIQVSYGSESPVLSDRRQFPLFFRTTAPDYSRNIAKSLFIKHFNWKVVAAFSQSENRYLLPVNHLVTELEKQNVSCVSTVTFSYENYQEQLEVLKRLDVRIIIGSFSTLLAPYIFCTVYALGMYGKEYVWILENHKEFWWHENPKCSQFQLQQAVNGVIIIEDYYPYPNLMQLTDTAKDSYDAVWAIALSLRISKVENLHQFSYENFNITQEIFEAMSRLEFIGVSGPVKFNGADRLGDFQVGQIQEGVVRIVALYDAIKDKLMLHCHVCRKVSWHEGNIPLAQRIVKTSLVMIPKPLFYVATAISFAGITCSMVILYFNMKFRELKTIKLSSPNLNNLTVVGCVLVYLSVILFGLNNVHFGTKRHFDKLCVARIYLLSAGFSLTFGSMFAKSYRVYRLFTYTTTTILKNKLLQDQQLIGLILIPLFIDVVTITLWMVTDPLKRHLRDLAMQISIEDPRIVYQLQIELCQCTNTISWHVALFGYKSIILIMAVYMAWKTRHVKIPALNDSQYIGICVYSAVFSTVLVVAFSFVTDYFILSFVVKTTSILASATITLILMFLPKVKSLLEEPDEGIMESMGLKLQSNTRRFINEDPKEIMFRLEIQNKVFRAELEALDKEIARLEELLEVTNSIKSANVNQIFPEVHYLNVPRASWPIWQNQAIKPFSSDNKLNNNIFFGRLKKLFGSLASLNQNHNNSEQKINMCNSPRSNPEMSNHLDTCNKYSPKNRSFD